MFEELDMDIINEDGELEFVCNEDRYSEGITKVFSFITLIFAIAYSAI